MDPGDDARADRLAPSVAVLVAVDVALDLVDHRIVLLVGWVDLAHRLRVGARIDVPHEVSPWRPVRRKPPWRDGHDESAFHVAHDTFTPSIDLDDAGPRIPFASGEGVRRFGRCLPVSTAATQGRAPSAFLLRGLTGSVLGHDVGTVTASLAVRSATGARAPQMGRRPIGPATRPWRRRPRSGSHCRAPRCRRSATGCSRSRS